MQREERLEVLSEADGDAVVRLADEVLASLEVEVMRGPTVGLLMTRVEEPAERLVFNFTEVTVSEAEVAAGPHRGYAMVMGARPEQALAAAVLDAAVEAGHPLRDRILAFLHGAGEAAEARWLARWATVEPTRVHFEEAR